MIIMVRIPILPILGCAAVILSIVKASSSCKCYCCDTTPGISNGSSFNHTTIELFTRTATDGLGSEVTQIVHAAAIASKLGWKFMGACGGAGKNVKMHKANELTNVNVIFGNSSEVRPIHCEGTGIDLKKYGRPWLQGTESKANGKYLMTERLHTWARKLPTSKIYHFESNIFEFSQETVDYFLDEPFLATVQKTGKCGLENILSHDTADPSNFGEFNISKNETLVASNKSLTENRALRVVAHYRRGDVDAAIGNMRESMTTHPSWYFNIMGAIKKIYPDVHLKAFTSCSPTKVGFSQCEQLNKTDVPIWRKHGIDLHVDNEGNQLGSTWGDQATAEWNFAFRSFATADVFITARSSFSQAATYFNANCVIRNSMLLSNHRPLKRWIEIADPGTEGQDRSYMTDPKMIEGLYNSYYNVSHLSITGQDPSVRFVRQLRSALKTCLPSKYRSLEMQAALGKANT